MLAETTRVVMLQSVVMMPEWVAYSNGEVVFVDAATAAQWISSGVAAAAPLGPQPGSAETAALEPRSETADARPGKRPRSAQATE